MFSDSRILAFHQTSGRFYPGVNNLRPGYFFAVLELIREWGFGFHGKDTEDGDDRLSAVITFDDGYDDNFDVLAGLCAERVRPIVFIPTAYIGQNNDWEYSSRRFPARHLNRGRIRELAGLGTIIGSHGKTHRPLTKMDDMQLAAELADSKKTLEDITGCPVDLLSFPFGRTGPRVNAAAVKGGYRHGFTLGEYRDSDADSGFALGRVPIYGYDDYFSLKAKLMNRSRFEAVKTDIVNRLAGGTIITSRRLK